MRTAVDQGQSTERRISSAFRNKRVREVHALPLGWQHLTNVDIAHIKAIIKKRAAVGADLRTLEACLLLWAAVTTGRHPMNLLTLSVRIVPKGERLLDQPPGLINWQGLWGWWLQASAPRDQRRDRPNMHLTASCLYLPATQTVARLVERCAAARQVVSSGRDHLSGVARPLFSVGGALINDVTEMLASRHPAGVDRARRATTTLEALARWLPAELIGAAGGDIVPASIITGRIPTVARTTAHYGAVAHRTIPERYKSAIDAVDALSHADTPGEALATYLGDRFTPTDDAVRALIAHLATGLADPEADAADRHLAMMRHTVALLSFAFAHRGIVGPFPSLSGVLPETRFCWIRDKVIRGKLSRRLVWICDVAMDQLGRYDRHLDELQQQVSPVAAASIVAQRHGSELALFDLRSGRVEPWTVSKAVTDALGVHSLPPNAGRHWIRATLIGRCSTETLHAFFGHGPIDDGSWDATSALDPAAYRADIARALDTSLADIGWTARSPSAQAMRS